MRPANRKLVISFLRPLRGAAGAATELLDRLNARLADADAERVAPEEETADDDKVLAVREARQAALKRRDVDLADRLAAVEQHLLGSGTPPQAQAEALFPPRSGKSARDERVADIRNRLLERTSRPEDDQA